MASLNAVLAILEVAEIGTRELDRAIDLALNPDAYIWSPEWWSGTKRDFLRWPDHPITGAAKYRHVNWYTTSIDTALTILPEWASYELTHSMAPASAPNLRFTRCRLWDWRRAATMFDPGNEWKSEGNRPLPLNICIAGLRARLADIEKDQVNG